MKLVPGAVLCGKYKLVQALASGGMGCIWSARHATLGTPLAIKFILPTHASSSDIRGRFELEAVASAKISSAHVVQVHDYGIEDDTPYLVMELLEGENLGARLKREKRLSLEDTCNILIQVAKGLRRANAAGIIPPGMLAANGIPPPRAAPMATSPDASKNPRRLASTLRPKTTASARSGSSR